MKILTFHLILFCLHRTFIELIGLSRYFYLRMRTRDNSALFVDVAKALREDFNSVVEGSAAILNQSCQIDVRSFDPFCRPRGLSMRDLFQVSAGRVSEGDRLAAICGPNRERTIEPYSWLSTAPFSLSNSYVTSGAVERAVSYHQGSEYVVFNTGTVRRFILKCARSAVGLTMQVSGAEVRKSLSEITNQQKEMASTGYLRCSVLDRGMLVIEDGRGHLRLLERFFNRVGFKVRKATNGLEALNVLDSMNAPPAALISDVHMPFLDGYPFFQCSGKACRGPMIHLTSDSSVETEIQALNRGAVAVVSKSRDPLILFANRNLICRNSTVEMAR